MKTILIVTDAWYPQVNGVVRSLDKLAQIIREQGYNVEMLEPSSFHTIPMPTYNEIRLSLTIPSAIKKRIEAVAPDAIHIATEGPLGAMARRYCNKRKIEFSTSFHTQYPEYLRARAPVPLRWTYAYFRRFHASAKYCLVSSKTVANRLKERGFDNIVNWSLGVDLDIFNPSFRDENFCDEIINGKKLKKPIFLYVGRVAVEKNIEAFLKLDLDGTKLVVGGGPQLEELQNKYPDVIFAGTKKDEELSRYYASADCFVFPSRTDTFGLVLLEAMASGVPVAAFPVQGPLDVVGNSGAGVLDEDLKRAALLAVKIPREKCRQYASKYTWQASVDTFLAHLPFRQDKTL
jgi:hypothetical protein